MTDKFSLLDESDDDDLPLDDDDDEPFDIDAEFKKLRQSSTASFSLDGSDNPFGSSSGGGPTGNPFEVEEDSHPLAPEKPTRMSHATFRRNEVQISHDDLEKLRAEINLAQPILAPTNPFANPLTASQPVASPNPFAAADAGGRGDLRSSQGSASPGLVSQSQPRPARSPSNPQTLPPTLPPRDTKNAAPALPPRGAVAQTMPRPGQSPVPASHQPRGNSSTLPPTTSQTISRDTPVARTSQTMPRNAQTLTPGESGGITGLFGRVFGNKPGEGGPPNESSEDKKNRLYTEYLAIAATRKFDDLAALRILYRAGTDYMGRSIVVMVANLPKDVDLDRLFLYFIATLDPVVEKDYVFVYIHSPEANRPPISWTRKVYSIISRKYKKNLKKLFIVYPTFWIKTVFGLLRPILSSKFWEKLEYIDSPEKLGRWMDPSQSQLPAASPASLKGSPQVKMFGVKCEDVMKHPSNKGLEMPTFVTQAIQVIELRGAGHEGIFRVSGSMVRIEQLKAMIDKGQDVNLEQEPDIHVVSGLLKLFFRSMAEPVVPFKLYDPIISSFDKQDMEGTVLRIKACFKLLPEFNRTLLTKLMIHLNKLAAIAENKMDSSNLAIVFGPNLLRPEIDTPEVMFRHAPIIPGIIKIVIENPPLFLAPEPTITATAPVDDTTKATPQQQQPVAQVDPLGAMDPLGAAALNSSQPSSGDLLTFKLE